MAVAGSSQDVAAKYGADETLDYRSKSNDDLAAEIRRSNGGEGIRYLYDAVSENGTLEVAALALQDVDQAAYGHVLPLSDEKRQILPPNVRVEHILCGTAHSDDSDGEFTKKWFDWLGPALDRGEFRPQRVTIIPGGLEGVAEGLRRLANHEVRGEKLVYRIQDTPGLA